MAKSQDKETQTKSKDSKNKERKALVGRVKKVIKKSRRRLTEEKFEKELQRTIAFLEQMQATLAKNHAEKAAAENSKTKPAAKTAKKSDAKSNSKSGAKSSTITGATPAATSGANPSVKSGAKAAGSTSKK
jgi:hypothetical protein